MSRETGSSSALVKHPKTTVLAASAPAKSYQGEAGVSAPSPLDVGGPTLLRVYWGKANGRVQCNLSDPDINHQSVVVVTASEGDDSDSTASPQRFVGAANFTVSDIAPNDGGVSFIVNIDWDNPLNLWTDIAIMKGFPQGFIRA
jgi:hypothetical protein